MEQLSGVALAALLGTAEEPLLVDVRAPEEFAAWSIHGARNVPLDELEGALGTFDSERSVVTVCATGARSQRAAELLERAGLRVLGLTGGMAAWADVRDVAELAAGDLEVVQVRRRGKGCLSYVVGAGGECLVVDPAGAPELYLDLAATRGWRVRHVVDSHLHADHLSASRALARAAEASLHLHPADGWRFAHGDLAEGDRFTLAGREVLVRHVPGHTPGSSAFVLDGAAVLTGDVLFVDGVGRPDLAQHAAEFAADLHRSLTETLLALDPATVVLPAHFGEDVVVRPGEPVASGLGELARSLAPLSLEAGEFIAWATGRATPRPPNYVAVVEANAAGDAPDEEEAHLLELGPNRCAV